MESLRNPAQFKRAFADATRYRGELFILHAAARPDRIAPRLGLAVSKRVDARAVVRNRIKRQVREAIRLGLPLPAIDLVVVALPAASAADKPALRQDMEILLKRLRTDFCLPAADPTKLKL